MLHAAESLPSAKPFFLRLISVCRSPAINNDDDGFMKASDAGMSKVFAKVSTKYNGLFPLQLKVNDYAMQSITHEARAKYRLFMVSLFTEMCVNYK